MRSLLVSAAAAATLLLTSSAFAGAPVWPPSFHGGSPMPMPMAHGGPHGGFPHGGPPAGGPGAPWHRHFPGHGPDGGFFGGGFYDPYPGYGWGPYGYYDAYPPVYAAPVGPVADHTTGYVWSYDSRRDLLTLRDGERFVLPGSLGHLRFARGERVRIAWHPEYGERVAYRLVVLS